MIKQAAIHLLIPIRFDSADFEKLCKDCQSPKREQNQELREQEITDQKKTFNNFFRADSISKTSQLSASPLINGIVDSQGKRVPLVKRVALTGHGRTQIGIYQNEGYTYRLSSNEPILTIGSVRIYFFSFGIGMIQVILEAKEKTEGYSAKEIVRLCGLLSHITWTDRTKFMYEMPKGPEEKKDKSTSLYQMLENLLKLQSYVPLNEFEGDTFSRTYQLVYLTGSIPEEDRTLFFDRLRNQEQQYMEADSDDVSPHIYSSYKHITWVTGDRSLICLGDLDKSDEENRRFLTQGEMKTSMSENYATIYAYCIARRLLFQSRVKCAVDLKEKEEGLRILLNLPQENFSTNDRINKLFDEYLWNKQWNLPQRIIEKEGIIMNTREENQPDREKNVIKAGEDNKSNRIVGEEESSTPNVDVVIITALKDEYKKVCKVFNPTYNETFMTGFTYSLANFKITDNRSIVLAIFQQSNMGLVPAAMTATYASITFHPEMLLMCGVCAAKKGSVNLGDLLVFSPVFDYGSGKYTDNTFYPDYHDYKSNEFSPIINQMCRNKNLTREIKDSWGDFPGKPDTELRIIICSAGSGAAVIADEQVLKGIRTHQRNVIAIDMEAAAIAEVATTWKIPWLVVKGVQDFANSEKNDKYRDYAAFVSAMFMKKFIEKYYS